MAEFAERIWRERLRIAVAVECDEPRGPLTITVLEPGAALPRWLV